MMNWEDAQSRALAVAAECTRIAIGREVERMISAGMSKAEAFAEVNANAEMIAATAEAARVRALRMMLEPYAGSYNAH